ncbi:anti-sigma-I factor RsgI family protein [Desulfuribacillus alkaliarsenatis]|uniref:Anti-sigma factor RsgI-like middle domain-containing protein n=1 Tax=Desulfuribacillus alkaliarsenatis TaxID=766136 RepID=A0A1E5G669_9FIRM|nr:hypothetical protein [Desulfuribacillus alkaliarsenatis]OEF98707.1 hypothetical protein BHF68_03335 [Desulfuribacillus alkaliarsenatis]
MNKWLGSILVTVVFASSLIYVVYYYDNINDNIAENTQENRQSIELLPPIYHLSIDVNPSISILLNANLDVVAYHSYNIEGDIVLNQLNLLDRSLDSTIKVIIEKLSEYDFIRDNSVIYFSLINENDKDSRNESLEEYIDIVDVLTESVYQNLAGLLNDSQIHIQKLDSSILKLAESQRISPGKLAIQLKSVEDLSELEKYLSENFQNILNNDRNSKIDNNIKQQEKQFIDIQRPETPATPNAPNIQGINEIPTIQDIPEINKLQ